MQMIPNILLPFTAVLNVFGQIILDISAFFIQTRQPVQLLAVFNFISHSSHIFNISRPVRSVFDFSPQM